MVSTILQNLKSQRLIRILPFLLTTISSLDAEVKLPSILGDHMVLQTGKELHFWGWAEPDEIVTVTIGGQSESTTATSEGKWFVKLNAINEVGPIDVTVEGSNRIQLQDVLMGDIWLASGQSNMEWPLVNADGGKQAISQANHPNLRLFITKRKASGIPEEDVVGHWVRCTPDEVNWFSAVAYYFGRRVQERTRSPIGLIQSVWGGTRVQPWTPAFMLERKEIFRSDLDWYASASKDYANQIEDWKFKKEHWQNDPMYRDPGNRGFYLDYAEPHLDDTDWGKMRLPTVWEKNGLAIDGAVWFRRKIILPDSWINHPIEIHFGTIKNKATLYWEGQQVGQIDSGDDQWSPPPVFKIEVPAERVRSKEILLSIRVFNGGGAGGFGGSEDDLYLSSPDAPDSPAISLAGTWQYKVSIELPDLQEEIYQKISRAQPIGPGHHESPANLYNGMIAPLTSFTLKGIIWYQGESNLGRSKDYDQLFMAMVQAWREAWKDQLPFFWVQLANYKETHSNPVESKWAEVRDGQRKSLAMPYTGMAVAIDIGEENDIHPRNKKVVGHRLALLALDRVYHYDLVESGPLYSSWHRLGDTAKVDFETFGSPLHSRGKPLEPKGFELAGTDGVYHFATALIVDNYSMEIRCEEVPHPVQIRYGWGDNPIAELECEAGLPASPFQSQLIP